MQASRRWRSALADAGGDGDGVEATICARDFEIHVDLFVQPGAEARADEVSDALVTPLERYLFSATSVASRSSSWISVAKKG